MFSLLMGTACGDSNDTTYTDPLAQAAKAMEDNPRFSIQIGPIGPQGEAVFENSDAEIWFILPDRFYWHEEGVYEHYAYNISIGNDGYVSDDAVYWEGGSGGHFDYEELNPYYFIKHAINPIEAERETINGKEYRVFYADLDIAGWKTDCLPGSYTAIDLTCLTDDGKLDKALIESWGYEFLRDNGSFLSIFNVNSYIEINLTTGYFQAYVNNANSLTTEMKKEFARIIEAFGMK